MPAFLIRFLLLYSAAVYSSSFKDSMNSNGRELHKYDPRQYYYITLTTHELIHDTFVLTIRSPCPTPEDLFNCEVASGVSYHHIRRLIYIPNTWEFSYVTYFFYGTAAIDVAYLKTNYVLEYVYPNLEFTGTPSMRLNDLTSNHSSEGYFSSYFYGFIIPPSNQGFRILIEHNGECVVWLDGQEYLREERLGLRETKGKVVYSNYPFNFQATLKNSSGSKSIFRIFWDISGEWSLIPGEALYYPERLSYAPYVLHSTGEGFYCEFGINEINCVNCGQLCYGCRYIDSKLKCQWCNDFAIMLDGTCQCNNGFVQNPEYMNECIECPPLCDSCSFTSNNQEMLCNVCVNNAELIPGVGCRCKTGYYQDPESNFICKPYYNLCTGADSSGSNEDFECTSCASNAVFKDNQCYCDDGYYQYANYDGCYECGSACQTCEHRRSGVTCKSCIEGASIYHYDDDYWNYGMYYYHDCRCDNGFYAMRPLGCLKCPDICKTCYYNNYSKHLECFCAEGFYYMYTNECLKCPSLCTSCRYDHYNRLIMCFTCQENAMQTDYDCICMEGYYKTRNDKCTTCEALCEVCLLDANEDLACNKCKENADFIEGVCKCIDRYTEPVHNEGSCVRCADRLCSRCTQYVASQTCNRCVDNAVDVNGECRCRDGFIARNGEDTCSPCTIKFCKLCDEVECQECFNPSVLHDDGTCICPSENYHIVDEECIPKDFSATISSSKDNYLEINFSVPPLNSIISSEYSIEFSIPNLSSLISTYLSKLSSTSYSINFSSPYKLNIISYLSITFKDSVKDAISQSLSTMKYSIEVRFYSSGDCIPINQIVNCENCSSNQFLKTCIRCDSSCRCIDASWQTCSELEPRIESANWNSDMLGFNILFSIQIQATSSVNNECSHYFTSGSLSQLGISPVCTLSQDLRNLIVIIGADCSLTLGSNVSLSSQISSVYNSNKRYTNTQPESITPPSQYPNPTAVLSIPSIISDCNDLKADGTQSFGNRRVLEYKWSVTGDDADNISNINNILKNENGNIITILNHSFNNLNSITITLAVKNAFGMTDSTTSTVMISKKFVPEVILQGGSEIKIVSTATFSPQITLKWPVCKTPPTSYRTEWSFNPLSNGSTRKLQSSSNNSQSYTITPNMLEADISYNLTATVIPETMSKDALPASATQIITTLPAPMFVTITRANRQASVYKDAILDGSLSNDSSYPNLPLSYSWDCKESNITCEFMKDLNNTTSKELFLPAGKMKSFKTYTFTLTVSNSKRSSLTSAYLQTLDSTKIPEVYLFTYESALSPQNINYLNPNYIVLANNELSQVEGLNLQWRIFGGPYILNSPSNQRSISIREDSLTYGISYTFSLDVRYEDYSTTSSITLYVNTPPLHGIFKISPPEGKELELFTFLTSGWDDVENNYPIRYELYKDVDNLWVKVIDLNYATIYEGKLSAGAEKNGYSTTYYIKAYDSLGAYSYTSSTVKVEPLPQEQAESIAFNTIEKLSQNVEVIENLDSIPYTVITLSDSLSRFETDDANKERRVTFVQDCLDLLSYYSEQDIDSTRQAASVISTLERLTIQPQVVNEYSRNEAVRMLNTSITKNEGSFKPDSVKQSVEIATNLYLSSEQDITIPDSTKISNSISYYNLLNNLGPAVVKNNIRNQDFSEVSTNIYKVLYQRVGPSTMNNKTFTLTDGQIIFPSSTSDELISQRLEGFDDDSVLDLSFIYSQQNSFTNYSSSFNQSLYYIKNAGVMYVDIKRTGKENDKGGVDFESVKTIELSNLTSPIEIYITVEYINITDQTPECVYLNELSMEWENSGCSFKEYLEDLSQIVCECYHMSYYSVADFKKDLYESTEDNRAVDLNPKRLLEAKLEDFYSVLIVMSFILIIHIVTSVYAYMLDRKDKRAPLELIHENEASRFELASNLSFKMNRDDNTRQEDIKIEVDKSPKSPKTVHPIQTKSLYMVYQEVEMQRKTFPQLFVLKHKLLELRYIRNHSLSKLARLSLLFYGIYANIFVLGFFYSIGDPMSFTDQFKQMAKAMEFEIQDVILFIYTKLIVLAPLIILRWMMTRNIKTLERSVKNRIGIVLILIGYIGSLLGILLLGINFTKYAIIMWMFKAVKAEIIDVMILSHFNAFFKACVFYLIQKHKLSNRPETPDIPESNDIPARV